jgi:hypothetical protein
MEDMAISTQKTSVEIEKGKLVFNSTKQQSYNDNHSTKQQ